MSSFALLITMLVGAAALVITAQVVYARRQALPRDRQGRVMRDRQGRPLRAKGKPMSMPGGKMIAAIIAVSLMALTTYVIREGNEAKYHQPPVAKPVAVQVDPKASDEDQYWQFVQGKTDPDFLGSTTQAEVVRVGQVFCAALEAHSSETARYLTEADPEVTLNSNGQWVIRGAARYLCSEEEPDVEAWYAAHAE